MAITPRSFLRSPLLLAASCLMWALTASAGYMFLSPCKAVQPEVATVVVKQAPRPAPAKHGWLGVQIKTMSPQLAQYTGTAFVRGALVTSLVQGDPGHNSGFERADVVTHFDGVAIHSAPGLKRRVMASAPGSRVPVRVVRGDVSLTLYPTLGERPRSVSCR